MENKIFKVTVNGSKQKFELKRMINEVFEHDGIRTKISSSGRKVTTDKFADDGKWIHRKIYDSEGKLELELTREFDTDGKVISLCEEHPDGLKEKTFYEYDCNHNPFYQYSVKEGPGEKYNEFWYKNLNNEVKNEYDEVGRLASTTSYKEGVAVYKTVYLYSADGLIEVMRSENLAENSVYCEITDTRKSAESPDRVSVCYEVIEI